MREKADSDLVRRQNRLLLLEALRQHGPLARVEMGRHTGLSPAAYARALREERARHALSKGNRVTDAIYDAGFSGPSRFYDNMEGRMGMKASAWVNGGKGATIHWAIYKCAP